MHVISSVGTWMLAGLLPDDSAPYVVNPRYPASDSSVSRLAMTPSATSAEVRTIFRPSPASRIGGAAPRSALRADGSRGLNHCLSNELNLLSQSAADHRSSFSHIAQ